jgi:hypothetical protein
MKCYQKGCENDNAICKHNVTGHYYCPGCAKKMNNVWPGRVSAPTSIDKQKKLGLDQLLKLAKKKND